MIEIRPEIRFQPSCPKCRTILKAEGILWQGIHTCCEASCPGCGIKLVVDLPVAHAMYYPFAVDKTNGVLHGGNVAQQWFGKPLLSSICAPKGDDIRVAIERISPRQKVVIVNCIDYLYGHALLRLFNVERHLRDTTVGVVVIVQDFLRWMVPEGVAEVWSVHIPLSRAQQFYPSLNEQIEEQCSRFETVFVSKAHTHPAINDIQQFSRVPPHNFQSKDFRITFIWREDRPWIASPGILGMGRRLKLSSGIISRQRQKVLSLFTLLRKKLPGARYTVAGLGTSTRFPEWVDDRRVDSFSAEIERSLCQVYAESRLITGVHGSHMLLPSAHAGMCVDLMFPDRWGNFAQDIVYQEKDSRIAAYRYRYMPVSTSIDVLAASIAAQVEDFDQFKKVMT